MFESLDANCIRQAALKVEGGAGPSGLDADAWRRLCMSFKSASDDLCHALVGFAKAYVWKSYKSLTLQPTLHVDWVH